MAKADKAHRGCRHRRAVQGVDGHVVTEYLGLTAPTSKSCGRCSVIRHLNGRQEHPVKRAAAQAGIDGLDEGSSVATAIAFARVRPSSCQRARRPRQGQQGAAVIKGGFLDGRSA